MDVNSTTELVRAFNWHSPSWDLFIFLFWAVASVFYAFAAGRGRIVNILISVYMAKLLTLEAPFLTDAIKARLPESVFAVQQLIVFALLFVVLFVFVGKYAFKTSADHRKMASLVFGLLFSLLQIGLLINTVLTLLPLSVQNSFSELVQLIFIRNPASFVWLILPVGYLILLGRHISHHEEL
jgi:MFS family permease